MVGCTIERTASRVCRVACLFTLACLVSDVRPGAKNFERSNQSNVIRKSTPQGVLHFSYHAHLIIYMRTLPSWDLHPSAACLQVDTYGPSCNSLALTRDCTHLQPQQRQESWHCRTCCPSQIWQQHTQAMTAQHSSTTLQPQSRTQRSQGCRLLPMHHQELRRLSADHKLWCQHNSLAVPHRSQQASHSTPFQPTQTRFSRGLCAAPTIHTW